MNTGVEQLGEALAGRYRVEHEIGRGGWGVVYRARDLRLPRTVAIKVLMVDNSDAEARERFRREIDFEARLVHPHIVPVIESGEVGDALYFVMPFVEGESLRERLLQEGVLAIADAVQMTRQISEGLAHAHERLIVHRDIKPANILLASGNAMIADFGIARALDVTADGNVWSTGSGLRLGTPAYMSPEQSAGDPGLDHRSDLYSLGCVLFEMLAGKPPFTAPSVVSLLGLHAVAPVPSLRIARPEAPASLDAVVARLLDKQPEARFPDARELIRALDAVLAELQTPMLHSNLHRPSRAIVAVTILFAILGTVALTRYATTRFAAHRDSLADTSTVVLFPFEGDPAESAASTELMRRAWGRWNGTTLIDAFTVTDAVGARALSSRRASAVARTLGAGRFIRGSVVRTDAGLELRAVLASSAREPQSLAEVTARLPIGAWTSRDSIAARAVTRLLFRQSERPDVDLTNLNTASLSAAQHYVAGRASIDQWALDSAAASLDRAWQLDQSFTEAALWLALVRYWRHDPPATWMLPAQAVVQDQRPRRDAFSRRHGDALLALANGERLKACLEWDALTGIAPLDFSAWYSAAVCRDRDSQVVRDPSAPTGWRFRSSFHTAQLQYLRAFQQLPTIHRALRDRAYERVRVLLYLSETTLRSGRVAEIGTPMLAFPILSGDTLVLAPVELSQVSGADTSVLRLQRGSAARVVRQQRELFRDITNVWVSADPSSADAHEAQALALQMLGDPAALDSMLRASALAVSSDQRRRLAASEVWMRVRLGVPDDRRSIRQARLLADSILRVADDTAYDATIDAMSALVGRFSRLQATRDGRGRTAAEGASAKLSALAEEIVALQLDAAVAAPQSALSTRALRVDSLISALVPVSGQSSMRNRAFSRAAALAFPTRTLPVQLLDGMGDDYLGRILAAVGRGDSVAVRSGVRELIELRSTWWPPETVAFDALVAETALLVYAGERPRAAAWLDAALQAQRRAAPDFDPVHAVAFLRAMVLRAQIASALGDAATAERWRNAVAELWMDADRSAFAGLTAPLLPRQ